MNEIQVAIVGLGTVGTGVAKLLMEDTSRVRSRAGKRLRLAKAVVRDLTRSYASVPPALITDQVGDVANDPNINIVAQLIGGLEPARSIMLQLLSAGKSVVTANKALLAEHGHELFEAARRVGSTIAFEASVAGGVPIVAGIGQCLSANRITSIRAILNGTSNYILSRMDDHGVAYAEAVVDAQQRGYAEADPSMDVDGTDAAQKLAILSHLAFGANPDWKAISRAGIDAVHAADLRYARELGYRIKLLAVAQFNSLTAADSLDLHVAPTLVRIGTPLAEVRGPNNAISVVGDAVGRVFFYGPGAGQLPTASAVVADIIDLAIGRAQLTFDDLNLWTQESSNVETNGHAQSRGRYYLRFQVEDHPGVLADISGVLAKHQISIASVIQHEPVSNDASHSVDLVIMTHDTTAGAMSAAVTEVDAHGVAQPGTVRMRVV